MYWFLTAFAEGAATVGEEIPEGGGLMLLLYNLIPIVILFGLMYVILILPQRKKEKKTREMIDSAIVGDKVISIGGICGKIVNIKDDEFTLESGVERTKITIKKWAVKEVDKPISD